MRCAALVFACCLLGACGASSSTGGTDLDTSTADLGMGPLPDLMPRQGVGSLVVTVTDDESGLTIPSRVLVTAVAPTDPIRFDLDGHGGHVNGEYGVGCAPGVIGAPEGVLLVSGAGSFRVTAGTYDLFITHGPEWEADTRRVTIDAKSTIRVDAVLRRVVDTRGWMAADLHVHTARSFDSQIHLDTRVVTEVAVGVELIVTTDHNVLSDLQPDLDQYGYTQLARAIVGDEFNFYEGHGGAYPMPYDRALERMGGGADTWKLGWDAVRLRHSADMFAYLRTFPTSPAITVNHPRMLPDLGYFINHNWAPPAPLDDAGKFDAIEILNGYMNASADLSVLLRDWFFLMSSGTRVTALGSSDTHRLRDVKAGFPRTWLRMPTEEPERVLDSDLAYAVKHQRAIASNGPWVVLTVDGAQIGDVITNQTGTVMIDATVDAPDWIDVDHARIYVNGKVAWESAVTRAPDRMGPLLHVQMPLTIPSGDAWIALQAGGTQPLPTALIGEHQGGTVVPFAITNAIFVDGDGDRQFNSTVRNLADADPGPVGPLTHEMPAWNPDINHPSPIDCEPPLWMDPKWMGLP